jgi:hypothetical protein
VNFKQFKEITEDINNKVKLSLVSLEENHKNLDEYAKRPVDYYEKIQLMGDLVRDGLQGSMEKLMQDV